MDKIVEQAMERWPNVPHCYGWLRLDARGNWRLMDKRTQTRKLCEEKIVNAALLNFINRNYTADEQGQWYFQNGPQRVYVDLETTPFVAHIDPIHGLTLHTGASFPKIESVWMTEHGQLIFCGMEKVAMLDDRDLAACMEDLRINHDKPNDEQLMTWLQEKTHRLNMSWRYQSMSYSVNRISLKQIADQFNFIRYPRKNSHGN